MAGAPADPGGMAPEGLDGWEVILVGGLEHVLFSHILGMSTSQLTFIFFRGVETANQGESSGFLIGTCVELRELRMVFT